MINLIVAIGQNNLIGKNNDLPWHYPEDLKYFKKTTLNKTVLMGENTFNSIVSRIGKPLPNRQNIVATLNKDFTYPGVQVIHDLITFLKENHNEEVFIIGGKQIYTLSLPFVDRLYITHINKEYDGNVYFPAINYNDYKKIQSISSGDLNFAIYERCK